MFYICTSIQADLFIVRPVNGSDADVWSSKRQDHKTELINDRNPPRILRYGNSPRYLAHENFEPIVRIFIQHLLRRTLVLYNIVEQCSKLKAV